MPDINMVYKDASTQIIKVGEHNNPAVTGETNITWSYTGELPGYVLPYQCRWDTTNLTVLPGAAGAPTGLTGLRIAIENWLKQMANWSASLSRQGISYPSTLTNVGHNFLSGAYVGGYLVAHCPKYTLAQKAAFFNSSIRGASDTTTAHEFFTTGKALNNNEKPGDYSPLVFANPEDANRYSLASIVPSSATLFTTLNGFPSDQDVTVDILAGGWIASLTDTYVAKPTVSYNETAPDAGDTVTATLTSTTGITGYLWQSSDDSGTTWTDTSVAAVSITIPSDAGTGDYYRLGWLRYGSREYDTTNIVVA